MKWALFATCVVGKKLRKVPILCRTEERHEERYAEIHHKTMKNGDDDEALSGTLGDDG